MNRFFVVLAWLLSAGTSSLMPWMAPFFDFKLISDYFQPSLNAFVSVVVVTTFAVAYVLWRQVAQYKKRRLMLTFFAATIGCLLVCLMLTWTVGVIWAPGKVLTLIIWLVWHIVYVAMFVCFAMGLCCMMLLIPSNELKKQPEQA